MSNTTFLTLGEAAKVSGYSKPTLSRALKSGKMTGKKGDDGSWQIDPAELNRVFPSKQSLPAKVVTVETPKETPEIKVLQAELEGKNALIEQLNARIEELSTFNRLLQPPEKAEKRVVRILGIPLASIG